MRFVRLLLSAFLFVALSSCASSAGGLTGLVNASTIWLGGQSTTFSAGSVANDFEAFGALSVSMSPHISAVGSLANGLGQGYTRASAGVRFSLHDSVDRRIGASVGIERQWYSDLGVGADEWVGKSIIGWDAQKWLNFTGTGAYGLTSGQLRASIGAQIPISVLK